MKLADITLSQSQYFTLLNPFVYHWRSDTESLYVGSSSHGWRRVLTHNVIDKSEPFAANHRLEIHLCSTADEAHFLETELIRLFNPKYNTNISGRKTRKSDFRLSPYYHNPPSSL